MKLNRVCFLTAALALALTSCQSGGGADSSQAYTPAGVAVQVQEVTADTISAESTVSGRVVTDGQESVFVSANAKCTAVYVEVGDLIQAGSPICTLDMTDTLSSLETAETSYRNTLQSYQDQEELFDAQIALAEQNILDAQKSYQDQQSLFDAQITLAEKNVRDLEALLEIGAAAQAELDQARLSLQSLEISKSSTLTQLEAGIQSAQSSLQSLQVSRSSTLTQLESGMRSAEISIDQLHTVLKNVDARGNVIAPISGAILSLNVAENSFAGPSAPVAVIDGVEQLEISVSVSEALVPKLALGDEVDVSIHALELQLTGSIRSIERSASMQTKLYNVTVSVPEDVEGLLPGMFADVSFRTETSAGAIVVPTEAILTAGGVQYVFVAENGTARYVEISAGLTGSGVTEITSGLKAGDLLVTVGQSYLSDGDAVRIVSGEG